MLQRERADELVCGLLHLDVPQANMTHWQEIIRKIIAPQHRVRIGVVGKYIGLQDAYKSVYEAISHGGIGNDCGVDIVRVDSEEIEKEGAAKSSRFGRHPGARRLRRTRIEGQNHGRPICAGKKIPYLGCASAWQIATVRICAKRFEIGQGAFDGI